MLKKSYQNNNGSVKVIRGVREGIGFGTEIRGEDGGRHTLLFGRWVVGERGQVSFKRKTQGGVRETGRCERYRRERESARYPPREGALGGEVRLDEEGRRSDLSPAS